jgi:hypothetical protein
MYAVREILRRDWLQATFLSGGACLVCAAPQSTKIDAVPLEIDLSEFAVSLKRNPGAVRPGQVGDRHRHKL